MTTPTPSDFDPTPSPPLPAEAADRLGRVSTATLTSVLLRLGIRTPFMRRVHPVAKGRRLVAKAYTLRYIPMREDLDGPALEGRFDNLTNAQRIAIEHVGPGDALVIDAREQVDAGTIGNILVTRMRVRGAAGLVTDGSFRDAEGIAAVGLPAYSAGTHAATNVTLHHPVDVQRPVACGGVAVFPGDALVGDDDGVIVIPRHLVEEAAARAIEQERRERFLLARVAGGASIIGTYPPDEATAAAYAAARDSGEV